MVTTFSYCRSSSPLATPHTCPQHTATRSNANGTYTKKGSGQEFRRNSRSPFLFIVPQEPFATWLYFPAVDHVSPCSRRNQRCTYSIASNWRALNPPLSAPSPIEEEVQLGTPHFASHCLQPFAGFGLVSENRVLEVRGHDRMLWHYSLLGKWPNGKRLTAREDAKVRRAALVGRSD